MAASSGSLRLDRSDIDAMNDAVGSYESTAQDALYELFQDQYILSVSNRYRGNRPDAFKRYLTDGPINITTEILDVTSNLTMGAELLAQAFGYVESSSTGRIDEQELASIGSALDAKRQELDNLKPELNAALDAASVFIGVTGLNYNDIADRYDSSAAALKSVKESVETADTDLLALIDLIKTRVDALASMIESVMAQCYTSDEWSTSWNATGAASMSSQDWYMRAGNVTLQLMMQEDPFAYATGQVSIAEDQWAAGLCQDVYAYAGYSFMGASGEAGVNGWSAFAKGAAALLSFNAYAQFTDYASGQLDVKAGYAEGDVKIGIDDGYFGAHANAKVGVFDAEGKLQLGSDEFNGYVSGSAKYMTAEGKAAFEFEDDGEFAIGAQGSASAGSVKGKAGFSFLSYSHEIKDSDGTTVLSEGHLFDFGVTGKAGAEASAGVYLESKTAIETDFVNINALSLSVDLTLVLGIQIDVTVPVPVFKWPW